MFAYRAAHETADDAIRKLKQIAPLVEAVHNVFRVEGKVPIRITSSAVSNSTSEVGRWGEALFRGLAAVYRDGLKAEEGVPGEA